MWSERGEGDGVRVNGVRGERSDGRRVHTSLVRAMRLNYYHLLPLYTGPQSSHLVLVPE